MTPVVDPDARNLPELDDSLNLMLEGFNHGVPNLRRRRMREEAHFANPVEPTV